jgi:hypothetical protein
MEATVIAAKMVAGAIIMLSGAIVIAGALSSQTYPANFYFGWMGVAFHLSGFAFFVSGLSQANRLGNVSRRRDTSTSSE